MKKTILIITILSILIIIASSEGVGQYTAYDSTATIDMNGKIIHASSLALPVVTINGNTYVPLRSFVESLYMNVTWIQEEQMIKIRDSIISKDVIVKMGLYDHIYDSYLITVYNTGKYEVSSGNSTFINGIKSKNFLDPMETKYKVLSEKDMNGLTDIISRISNKDFQLTRTISDDLSIAILINDTVYEYDSLTNEEDGRTENMQNLIERLIQLSPLELHIQSDVRISKARELESR